MRSRLRASDFCHSRSFSAPSVPSLRLIPPTPHGSYHETDYDSDVVPISAAAMPRPNKYRRRAAAAHPYASSSHTSSSSSSSSSPTLPSEEYQSINPGYFSGSCVGRKIAAFSIVLNPDGETVSIQGKLMPNHFPSEDVKERRSWSQPSSPHFFQIDPAIAGLGLQNPPVTTANNTNASPPLPPRQQQQQTTSPTTEKHNAVPVMGFHPGKMDNVLFNYASFQQNMPMWPVEQIPGSYK